MTNLNFIIDENHCWNNERPYPIVLNMNFVRKISEIEMLGTFPRLITRETSDQSWISKKSLWILAITQQKFQPGACRCIFSLVCQHDWSSHDKSLP